MNDFAFCCTGLLACDDGSYGLRSEGVPGIDGDIMFCAGGFDLFEVGEVAGYNAVYIKSGFEGGVCASGVGGYLPIWVGLLEGSSAGYWWDCQ
jgi:hypothetical protein